MTQSFPLYCMLITFYTATEIEIRKKQQTKKNLEDKLIMLLIKRKPSDQIVGAYRFAGIANFLVGI